MNPWWITARRMGTVIMLSVAGRCAVLRSGLR